MNAHLPAGKYFGTERFQSRFGNLILSESAYGAEDRLPKHCHENAYIIVTLEGTQSEDVSGEQRTYQRGTLAIHPAREVHSQRIGTHGLRCLHIEFRSAWLDRDGHVCGALGRPVHLDASRSPSLELTTRTILHELQNPDDLADLAIEGCVLNLLVAIRRMGGEAKSTAAWLKKAREILHDCYRERLSLNAIADSVGVHPVHLARAFRRYHQCTVAEYVRRLRINSACETTRRGEAPLSQIALECGFADQAHFTRVFKRVMGVTPSQFRSRNGRG